MYKVVHFGNTPQKQRLAKAKAAAAQAAATEDVQAPARPESPSKQCKYTVQSHQYKAALMQQARLDAASGIDGGASDAARPSTAAGTTTEDTRYRHIVDPVTHRNESPTRTQRMRPQTAMYGLIHRPTLPAEHVTTSDVFVPHRKVTTLGHDRVYGRDVVDECLHDTGIGSGTGRGKRRVDRAGAERRHLTAHVNTRYDHAAADDDADGEGGKSLPGLGRYDPPPGVSARKHIREEDVITRAGERVADIAPIAARRHDAAAALSVQSPYAIVDNAHVVSHRAAPSDTVRSRFLQTTTEPEFAPRFRQLPQPDGGGTSQKQFGDLAQKGHCPEATNRIFHGQNPLLQTSPSSSSPQSSQSSSQPCDHMPSDIGILHATLNVRGRGGPAGSRGVRTYHDGIVTATHDDDGAVIAFERRPLRQAADSLVRVGDALTTTNGIDCAPDGTGPTAGGGRRQISGFSNHSDYMRSSLEHRQKQQQQPDDDRWQSTSAATAASVYGADGFVAPAGGGGSTRRRLAREMQQPHTPPGQQTRRHYDTSGDDSRAALALSTTPTGPSRAASPRAARRQQARYGLVDDDVNSSRRGEVTVVAPTTPAAGSRSEQYCATTRATLPGTAGRRAAGRQSPEPDSVTVDATADADTTTGGVISYAFTDDKPTQREQYETTLRALHAEHTREHAALERAQNARAHRPTALW